LYQSDAENSPVVRCGNVFILIRKISGRSFQRRFPGRFIRVPAMKISRRTFLKGAGMATLASTAGCLPFSGRRARERILVNDVHTRLNPTWVRNVSPATSLDGVRQRIWRAARDQRPISIAGGRHAAGGQQFATDAELIDTVPLNRVLSFDQANGFLEAESGIQWPQVMAFLREPGNERMQRWSVAQKQTGTDRLSLGGALSANAHGRGLRLPPFIANVESFVLIDANGVVRRCSRSENADLFRLAAGGYGLFGFVYSVQLRLVPRRKVRRQVNLIPTADLAGAFAERIRDGFLFGDFQFTIDAKADDFLQRGILACYEPVPDSTPVPVGQRTLSGTDWKNLLYLAHAEPSRAFDLYAAHYLATSGQIYESDSQYVSDYFDDYHRDLDARISAGERGTEVIGELYVPREILARFLGEAREQLRQESAAPLIYGTIRLIEQDTESFLCWAKQSYACVIFNFHTPHTESGLERTARTFRNLIDLALAQGGNFYLTYHRYATRSQVLSGYPQFREFLRLKLQHDPQERFQSNWYRHYKRLMA
jgi:FAD/FMN-containing dehydrogenase